MMLQATPKPVSLRNASILPFSTMLWLPISCFSIVSHSQFLWALLTSPIKSKQIYAKIVIKNTNGVIPIKSSNMQIERYARIAESPQRKSWKRSLCRRVRIPASFCLWRNMSRTPRGCILGKFTNICLYIPSLVRTGKMSTLYLQNCNGLLAHLERN
jgi:hypothetical protein